ncbi:MAG TPA: methyltransferase domain-containing protein [Burkholderiales bacterium]|nr:methyltransferase domain-containing protein [Burkholderiales bacterium]
MSQERWQLTGSGPESYERYQVPSVFEPLARKFLAHMALRPGQRVLDVACGTGIVARLAAKTLGPQGSIVGVDLNPKMLELARAHAPDNGARVEWKEGDAASLPCADADFDVVLCQQGLQFLPDKVTALREMHRVLRPAGRLGLCVWRSVEYSPCHLAIADALRRHVGADTARRFQAPFSFGDAEALKQAVAQAGFRDIDIQVDVLMRRLLPPEESIPGLLASTPVGPEVAALPERTRVLIISEVAIALTKYRSGDGLEVPQPTHVVRAVK